MTPDAAGIEAALAAGLAAHELCHGTSLVTKEGGWYAYCSCGDWQHTAPTGEALYAAHRAHQAAALLPVVTQAQAEALREAADRWTQGAWADVMLPKPTPPAVPVIAYANRFGDWLRARADESGAS